MPVVYVRETRSHAHTVDGAGESSITLIPCGNAPGFARHILNHASYSNVAQEEQRS